MKKGYNPKGLGLFLWGYAKLYAREKNARYLEKIDRIPDLLDELKSRDCTGNGWGYNFDWQSRAFFVPKWTPTVVNSAFIGHALLDTWKITGSKRALDMALPIADFILEDLNRREEAGRICFSYTPLDHYHVHNANLLGASLLIRLYEMTRSLEKSIMDVPQSVDRSRDLRVAQDWLDSRRSLPSNVFVGGGNDKGGGG